MRMVPSSPHDTGSSAEKRIFERLQSVFDDRYAVLHSLKPTRHPYKRFPEIDFVVCGPEGLYVLEVKGGKISYRNGVWHYQNRYGDVTSSHEGPFRQAEGALHGLIECLRVALPRDVLVRFPTGYGVVFPDCEWQGESAEWDTEMLADMRRSRNMEGWLRNLFRYWQERCRFRSQLESRDVEMVQTYLRPEVAGRDTGNEARLFEQVVDIQGRVARLTEDQMRMADVAEINPRVLCAGGAGSGKTFLAERLARRWADSGLQVALVCKSSWLRHFLASRLSMPGVTVSQIDGVSLDCRRAGLQRFDALIVDEGQDLFEMPYVEVLDSVLSGGLETGRWSWFHDLNNQSLTDRFDPRTKVYLESLEPVMMPLRINCRNTRVILEWIQESLGADLGAFGAGAGPDVRVKSVRTPKDSAEHVASEILELVDVGGLAPGSITILSPFEFAESSISKMPQEVALRVRRLDEYSMRSMPVNKIGFAKIGDFKGLENEAIIVVDLPPPNRIDGNSAEHYVAMSRARSVLSLVYWDV